MKPARYIFLNRSLGMSAGKAAAQAAHAETLAAHDYHHMVFNYEGYSGDRKYDWVQNQLALYNKWYGDGHYAKYVMEAADSVQLTTIERYLNERGFKTYLVIDEGHTEGTYFVPTAMSVELVDKDDERVSSIFGEFKLYRDKEPKPEKPRPKPSKSHKGQKPFAFNIFRKRR
jgi:peptidyl-tRNA hydrolase